MSSLVSIIMPTFNGAQKYIDEAVQSCLAQTHAEWELVIVDDASTDDTPRVIAGYSAQDPRICSIRHAMNRKLPGALNTGIRHMRGDFFTWLSDDDLLRPNALEEMVNFLNTHPDVGLVYTDYSEINAQGAHIRKIVVGSPEELGPHKSTGVSHLVRREVIDAIGGYAEDLFLAEDLDFWIRAAIRFKIQPYHIDLFLYRQHAGSLTSSYRSQVYLVHAEILRRHLKDMHWLDAAGRSYAYLRMTKRALIRRDIPRTGLYLVYALRQSPPFVLRSVLRKLISLIPGSSTRMIARGDDSA